MLLRTFQPLPRVERLTADGILTGSWDHVPPGVAEAYRAMVAAMERAGVSTGGQPPVWAWHGPLRLMDAVLLFDADHELSRGFATVEFDVPAHLVVTSDYGRWNDFLASTLAGQPSEWEPGAGDGTVQACVPCLRREWVRDVRPLPTAGWDALDLAAPA